MVWEINWNNQGWHVNKESGLEGNAEANNLEYRKRHLSDLNIGKIYKIWGNQKHFYEIITKENLRNCSVLINIIIAVECKYCEIRD